MVTLTDSSRLTVAVVEVHTDREAEFADIAERLAALLSQKNYGVAEMIPDESDKRRFYAVRRWTSAAAAERCHADADIQALNARLLDVARVTHVVNGLRRPEQVRLLLDDRRTLVEADRRVGFDRRVKNVGRPEGDRRSGVDRRLGPRRVSHRAGHVDLLGAARRAREYADAAFSNFKVGAALETADGAVITGCNIENATFGLTTCAERVAMFKALSEGHRAFTRIAVVADWPTTTPPCGACRQILWEFGGNLEVRLGNLQGETGCYKLKDLLPLPFDARSF